MKTNTNVDTKLDKKGVSVTTALVLDWTGCTLETVIPLAQKDAIITLQGRWRRNKQIPPKQTVLMKDFIAGLGSKMTVVTVEGIAQAATAMTPEERSKLLKQLQEMDKQQKAA